MPFHQGIKIVYTPSLFKVAIKRHTKKCIFLVWREITQSTATPERTANWATWNVPPNWSIQEMTLRWWSRWSACWLRWSWFSPFVGLLFLSTMCWWPSTFCRPCEVDRWSRWTPPFISWPIATGDKSYPFDTSSNMHLFPVLWIR